MWKVYKGKKFTGIIESNYAYAFEYWKNKKDFKLVPFNDNHLIYPYEK